MGYFFWTYNMQNKPSDVYVKIQGLRLDGPLEMPHPDISVHRLIIRTHMRIWGHEGHTMHCSVLIRHATLISSVQSLQMLHKDTYVFDLFSKIYSDTIKIIWKECCSVSDLSNLQSLALLFLLPLEYCTWVSTVLNSTSTWAQHNNPLAALTQLGRRSSD